MNKEQIIEILKRFIYTYEVDVETKEQESTVFSEYAEELLQLNARKFEYKTIQLYGEEINGELEGKIIHIEMVSKGNHGIIYEIVMELPQPIPPLPDKKGENKFKSNLIKILKPRYKSKDGTIKKAKFIKPFWWAPKDDLYTEKKGGE